jgi:hypothetical protein
MSYIATGDQLCLLCMMHMLQMFSLLALGLSQSLELDLDLAFFNLQSNTSN